MQGSAKLCPAIRELPGRCDAEKALAAAQIGGRHLFLAAAVLSNQATRRIEEGDWAGADRALLNCFENLTRAASPGDRIFRWTGSSLVMLMERSHPDAIRRELAALPGDDRRKLFDLAEARTPETLFHRLDHFIATSL